MPNRPPHLGKPLGLGSPSRPRAGEKDPQKEPVKTLVIARRHRIARGADMAVMHQKMFGAEMAVKHGGQQEIAQPAFNPVSLMQKLMGIDDADGSRNHPDPEHQADGLGPAAFALGHPPDCAIDQKRLHRKPGQGDQPIPE